MRRARRNFLAVLGGVAVTVPTAQLPTPANIYEHLRGCWSFYETGELLNGKPVRKDEVALYRNDSHAVLCEAGRDVMRLNNTASRIWELCDGKNSPAEIAHVLSKEYDVSPSACFNDVVISLRTFRREGLIRLQT
jgi:hypothetical protein